jgi:hypothetical protein
MLHETPIFTGFDPYGLSGASSSRSPAPALPATESLRDRLMTLPPFTKVPEDYVRQCARALRKVAEAGALLSGEREQRPAADGLVRGEQPAQLIQ